MINYLILVPAPTRTFFPMLTLGPKVILVNDILCCRSGRQIEQSLRKDVESFIIIVVLVYNSYFWRTQFMYYDLFYFYKFGQDIREHIWKKPGDPVIRSQTEIQFLWRRRAKFGAGDGHHKIDQRRRHGLFHVCSLRDFSSLFDNNE